MAERPLFLGRSQPAARINRPPTAGDFHTCGLRGVFCHAHVTTKNDFNLFRAVRGAKICDAFNICGRKVCDVFWRDLRELLLFCFGGGREFVEQGEA